MTADLRPDRDEAPTRADGKPRQVVAVTGASAGVGRAVVRAFAARGADVGLIARGRDGLEGAKREVEEAGGRAVIAQADVADPDAVEAAAALIESELGPIDVWVNDAMTTVFAPVKDIEDREFRRVTEVTYLGTVYGTKAALRRMLPRDRGAIVQVGSALAFRAIPLQSAYCAAKHAVRGFTDALRTELMHDGSHVTISMVQLPAMNTPQFEWSEAKLPHRPQPVPPIYEPEVAADAVVWAARNAPREIAVAGSSVLTINGNKVAPGLADRYLARTGYQSQQTDEEVSPSRPSNLWSPVAGDHGARGPFSHRAKSRSWELWARMHRRALTGAAAAASLAAAGATASLVRRNGRSED